MLIVLLFIAAATVLLMFAYLLTSQAAPADTLERSDLLVAEPHVGSTVYDDLQGHNAAAPESVADHTLPTSTHVSAQEDIPETVSKADNTSGPSCSGVPKSYSTSHLSVQSHGSFMHVEGLALASDAGCNDEADTTQACATSADLPGPSAQNALEQDEHTVQDRLSQDMSEQAAEESIMHTEEELTEACFSNIVN